MPVQGWNLTGGGGAGRGSYSGAGASRGSGAGRGRRAAQEPLPWDTPEAANRAHPSSRMGKGTARARSTSAGGTAATAPQADATGRPAGVPENAVTVSQALEFASTALNGIPMLTVLGEVSGFRGPNARSGHCYFQIKDDAAAVDCIIWRGTYSKRTFDLRDGLQVLMTGQFNLYKPTGRMSFVAKSFSLAGEGLLRQQVAELAEKLRREGLMDPARKRHIPVFCTRVAVVTSLSGAVIDDVKRTLARRNPLVEIMCVGAKVQGEGAPEELITALGRAAALNPDCILLVRGGGSFEDLMTFNDEALARAVAACPVPVVTGIGHEPDTSICDMVSDRRASTPTAAAESVAPAMQELVDVLNQREQRLGHALSAMAERASASLATTQERLARAISTYVGRLRLSLDAAAARPCLANPGYLVERRQVELAQTEERLARAGTQALTRFQAGCDRLAPQLARSGTVMFQVKQHALNLAAARLRTAGERLLDGPQASLARAAASLDALSPLKVLARGYAITYGEEGVRTKAAQFAPGDALRLRMADGEVSAQVTAVSPHEG